MANAAEFRKVLDEAVEAGLAAVEKCKPVPMHVVERANPLDDNSPVVRRYAPVEGGVCGFAGVRVKGNTAFGRFLKKEGLARRAYGGGLYMGVYAFGQSLERKEAYAYAFSRVLNAKGINAYVESRMD